MNRMSIAYHAARDPFRKQALMDKEQAEAGGVAAVNRALAILQAFENSVDGMTLTDLMNTTGLYHSTILRLCESLENFRYLKRLPDGRYMLGPTPFYALFTGVLLFVSSLVAGWFENWFVWHRLDSAIAWNPKIVARLGAARARRWSVYWRQNITGFASNISLGLMLGLVPPVAAFFALPLDVRHVTLASGQLAAAVGALGLGTLLSAAFWWCVAGIAVTGLFNLAFSFFLAFRVALRSRGIRLADESRIRSAFRRRLWQQPLSFLLPPRQPAIASPA